VRWIKEANCDAVEQQIKNLSSVPSYGLPACNPNVAGSVEPARPGDPSGACAEPDAAAGEDVLADADVEAGVDAVDALPLAAGDSVVGAVAVPHAAITSDNTTITLTCAHVFFRCILPSMNVTQCESQLPKDVVV